MPDASILLASLNLIYVLLQTKPKSFSLFVSQQFHQFSLLIRLQLHLLRFLLFRYIICKFAMKGLTPSQIGVILGDSHGIAQVNSVTRSKILRILKAYEILEDLYHLIKKAVAIRKHLERNRKDKDSKFRLILVETDPLVVVYKPVFFAKLVWNEKLNEIIKEILKKKKKKKKY
ncbi:hypothetical protein R6Q59_023571 [Mikania micrantha]